MWTGLILLLSPVAVAALLLLVAFASPLRIEVRASFGEVQRYSVALRPFGRVGPRLAVVDSTRPPGAHKETGPKKKQKEKTPKNRRRTRRDPARIFGAVVRLVPAIVGKFSVDRLALDMRFGAEDPAETGQIFGVLTPFVYGTWGMRRFDLKVEPVFDRAVLDGDAALDVQMTPARLIPPLIRFGWSAFGPSR